MPPDANKILATCLAIMTSEVALGLCQMNIWDLLKDRSSYGLKWDEISDIPDNGAAVHLTCQITYWKKLLTSGCDLPLVRNCKKILPRSIRLRINFDLGATLEWRWFRRRTFCRSYYYKWPKNKIKNKTDSELGQCLFGSPHEKCDARSRSQAEIPGWARWKKRQRRSEFK